MACSNYESTKLLSEFKNTTPNAGEILYLISSSTDALVCDKIIGINISTVDCSFTSRNDSVSNLTSFEIGGNSFEVKRPGEKYTGYYYYELNNSPDYPCENLTPGSENPSYSCTATTLRPEFAIDEFKNTDHNVAFNNAINLRRIQITGSLDTLKNGIFEIDRINNRSGSLIPQNLNAILSGSAVTASFQESNLYSKAWTSGRYDGTKLTSGSLYLNDPALTFKPFEAAKFALEESSSLIRSTSFSDLNIETFYFNPPFKTIRTGLVSYFQGSIAGQPPANQPVYKLVGKDFKRLTRTKLYIPSVDEIVNIYDYRVAYEPRPVSRSASDNVFYLEMQTLSTTGDTIRYYTGSAAASLQTLFIRPGDAEEIIVSASFVTSTGEYSLDAIDETGLRTPPDVQPWQSDLGRQKTYVSRIISSSRNIP